MYSQNSNSQSQSQNFEYSQRSDYEIATQCENTVMDSIYCSTINEEVSVNTKPKAWARLVSLDQSRPKHVDLMPSNIIGTGGRLHEHKLGRSNKCDVKFDGSVRVSNEHCVLYCKRNETLANGRTSPSSFTSSTNEYDDCLEAWIEDKSANGTFITRDFVRLTKNCPRLLRHGDEVYLINPDTKGDGTLSDEVLKDSFIVLLFLPSASNQNNKNTIHRGLSSLNITIESGRTTTVTRLLQEGRMFEQHYDRGDFLASGVSGTVYKCTKRSTNEMFAVKVIDKRKIGTSTGNSSLDGVLKEAEMLRSLRHPNIIHLEDIFENDANIFLVMELSLGGDLFDRLYSKKFYREDEARKVMKQILEAIAFLHSNNIAHRDLKPENILLTSRNSDVDIKIIDFGLAKKLGENGKLKTICGTPQYFAPEVLQQKNNELGSGYYSLEADMWSLGVMLYVLLSGQYPFISKTGGDSALYLNITNGRYSFDLPIWNNISNEAKILIKKLLVVEASRRLTAKEALLSNWILGRSEEVINVVSQSNNDKNNNNNSKNSNDIKCNENEKSPLVTVSQDITNDSNDTTGNQEQENENNQQTMKTRRKQMKSEENGDLSVRRSSRKKSRHI